MIINGPRLQNIFGNKSSIVLRALLREPGRRWTTRQLATEGASIGLVAAVLNDLEASGMLTRHSAGRFSYVTLSTPDKLLFAWTQAYRFHKNPQAHFFSTDKEFLNKLIPFLVDKRIRAALTLFSASNLIAPYVVDAGTYLYLDIPKSSAEDVIWKIQAKFSLVAPKAGANIHFALPIYGTSVFRDIQIIQNYPVASNLQVYLDLAGYSTAGAEQAAWMAGQLKERGTPLA